MDWRSPRKLSGHVAPARHAEKRLGPGEAFVIYLAQHQQATENMKVIGCRYGQYLGQEERRRSNRENGWFQTAAVQSRQPKRQCHIVVGKPSNL